MSVTEGQNPRVRRAIISIEEDARAVGITVKPGETLLYYQQASKMQGALQALAAKYLPRQFRAHIAACLRAIDPWANEYQKERTGIQKKYVQIVGESDGEGTTPVTIANPIGMAAEVEELGRVIIVVTLPEPITDAMLPVKDKDHPNNEDGLEAILAELGPLYVINKTA